MSKRSRVSVRLLNIAVGAALIFCATPGAAQGINPPVVDSGKLEISKPVAPPEATEQKGLCGEPSDGGGTNYRDPSAAQRLMQVERAWQYSTGAGQTVAVIDTGVKPSGRFGRVIAGGDYVSNGDGLQDCDGHGTMVAAIIAAKAKPDSDAFAGVAPDSTILSIRQTSLAFSPKNQRTDDSAVGMSSTTYGDVRTLAWAVVRAVQRGATVINISEIACDTAGQDLHDQALGAALKYAYDRNVVVVAAAGNLVKPCDNQNPAANPTNPSKDGWDVVRTVVSPAWYSKYVLTVGGVDSTTGQAWPLSINGPWVSVAAPATKITTLGPKGRTVNAQQGQNGLVTLDGTSYSAPYVAGLAALIKSRFRGISAQGVMDRITRTAHGPGPVRDNAIGYGVVDPVAALTATLPDESTAATSRKLVTPATKSNDDNWPRVVAGVGTALCLAVAGIAWAVSLPHRRLRKMSEDEY